jgi:sulfoxide reductase heme-binding subunit YedZ
MSALRIGVLVFLAMPVGLAAHALMTQGLGARPINDLIHRTGYWALVFLMVTLAVTPLARTARFGRLMDVRRMIGVGAFVYAGFHIFLFFVDQMFDLGKVASEIVLRLYLTIGFTALVMLAILAATSTDGMVRRLGPARWQRLHRAVYAIALLGLIHFFQQTKSDIWVPTFVAGLFVWLMGYRLLVRFFAPDPSALGLAMLAGVAAALTFAGEAVGIGLYYRVSPLLVLQTSLDFDPAMIRPGWLVLGAGLCIAALQLVRGWSRISSSGRRSVGRSPAVNSQAQEA